MISRLAFLVGSVVVVSLMVLWGVTRSFAVGVPPEFLITEKAIGPVEIGMEVEALKQKLGPDYTFRDQKNFMDDVDAIEIAQGEDVQWYLLFPGGEKKDRVIEILTENSKYMTGDGIGTGTPLALTFRFYGKPTLSYNEEYGSREMVSFPKLPKTIHLNVAGPQGSKAGKYARGSGPYYETQEVQDGAEVTSVRVSRP